MKKEKWFSNCIIEAVKAKMKNWNNVEIIFQPKFMGCGRGFHFFWREKDSGLYYDFKYDQGDKWICKFLFQGCIRCQDEEHYSYYRNKALSSFTEKLGEKMMFRPYQNIHDEDAWRMPFEAVNLNFLPSQNVLYSMVDEHGEVTIKISNVSSLTLEPYYTEEDISMLREMAWEENETFDEYIYRNEMTIKDFSENPHITGWKFLMEKIPMEHEER